MEDKLKSGEDDGLELAELEKDAEIELQTQPRESDELEIQETKNEDWKYQMHVRAKDELKTILYGLRGDKGNVSHYMVKLGKQIVFAILASCILGILPFLPVIVNNNQEVVPTSADFGDELNIPMYLLSLWFFGFSSSFAAINFGNRLILHDIHENSLSPLHEVSVSVAAGFGAALMPGLFLFLWKPVPFGFFFAFNGWLFNTFCTFVFLVCQTSYYKDAGDSVKKEMKWRLLLWVASLSVMASGFLTYMGLFLIRVAFGSDKVWFQIVFILCLFAIKEVHILGLEMFYDKILGDKFYIHMGQQWSLTLHAFFLAIVLGSDNKKDESGNGGNSGLFQVIFVVVLDITLCFWHVLKMCWNNAKIDDELAHYDEKNAAALDRFKKAALKVMRIKTVAQQFGEKYAADDNDNKAAAPAEEEEVPYQNTMRKTLKTFVGNAANQVTFGKGRQLTERLIEEHDILKDALYLILAEFTELVVPLVVLICTTIFYFLNSGYYIGNVGEGGDLWGYSHIDSLGAFIQNIGTLVACEIFTFGIFVNSIGYYGVNLGAALSLYMEEVGFQTSFMIALLVVSFYSFLYLPYGCNPNFQFDWLN